MRSSYLLLLLLCLGCSRSRHSRVEMTAGEFGSWIKSNSTEAAKLSSKKTFGDISYEVRYIPAELRVFRELGSYSHHDFKQSLAEARKLETYQIKIYHKEGLGILNVESNKYKSYDQRVKYFSFDIQRRIKLLVGKSEVSCVLSHFERTFEASPYTLIDVAFESKAIAGNNIERIISIDDDYFGIGKINLGISEADLNKFPIIKS